MNLGRACVFLLLGILPCCSNTALQHEVLYTAQDKTCRFAVRNSPQRINLQLKPNQGAYRAELKQVEAGVEDVITLYT